MSRSSVLFLVCASALFADITQLVPDQVTAGSGPITLRAYGGYFVEGEYLTFNGTRLNTVVVGGGGPYSYATELRATIPAELLRTPGRATVTLAGYNSLPFLINPAPTITTPSPLPNGAQGSAYSLPIEVSGGTPRFEWNLAGNTTLPPGLTLNRGTGVIAGTPTAQGIFTFTIEARDASQVAARRLYTVNIGAPGSLSNFISCAITPRNSLFALHVPEAHRAPLKLYPDHTLRVVVSASSGSVANLPITLTASQVLFPDNSGMPASLSQSATTDSSGTATFLVNPLSNVSFDTTKLTATGRRGATGQESFACEGSIVSGAGAMFGLLQTIRQDAAVVLGALDRRLDFDSDRFYPEIESILAGNGDLERRALQAYEKYFPTLRKVLRGEKANLRKKELRDLDQLVASLETHASFDLRKALHNWRKGLFAAGQSLPPQRSAHIEDGHKLALEPGQDPKAQALLVQRPLHFERNDGQAPRDVHFLARGLRESAVLAEDGLQMHFGNASSLRMRLGDVRNWPKPEGVNLLPIRSYYLKRGSQREVPHFEKVRYANVYKDTDLVFYSDGGRLRHDFILAPGADPSRIHLEFPDAGEIGAQEDGSLVLHYATGATTLGRPYVYQIRGKQRVAIASRYTNHPRGGIGFELGAYDRRLPLVIDPVLSYAAFHGGSQLDSALAITVDAQGSAYIAGLTTSNNWPNSARALQGNAEPGPNNVEAFVTKFSPDGKTVLFTTYFGGSANESASAIALDPGGNIYVAGQTNSPDFPTRLPLQANYGGGNLETGGDAFVMKLNPTGSAAIYSTYLGGSRGETARAIAIDATGAAYIAGMTASTNFPTRNAVQAASRGGEAARSDAYVAKLSPDGNALVYSTYLGGSGDDYAMALSLDAQSNAIIAGTTFSNDFPTMLALQPSRAGGADAFVTKLNAAGNAITYSSYFGGTADDFGIALALDAIGNVHLGGMTGSLDFPLFRPLQAKFGSAGNVGFDGFVTKFLAFSNDMVYSTFLGGAGMDLVNALVVGPDNALYIAGETDSPDFPTRNALRPQGAFSDAFLAKWNADGSAFEYSGALGGQALDSAVAIAIDRAGNVYLAGTTSSRDNPATLGASQSLLGGRSDAFAMKVAPGANQPLASLLSAAALQPGQALAPESIVSAFGVSFAPRLESAASAQLPLSLAGTSVLLRDSSGTTHTAPLYFVSPTQVNFLVPRGVAAGLAEISIQSNGREVATASARVSPYAPGLFSANADGKGAPAGFAIRLGGSAPLFQCGATAGSCAPARIDVAQPTYLTLFGSGLRGAVNLPDVKLSLGGVDIPVTFAGAQGEYPGLDQLNAGPIPPSLAGRGPLELILRIGNETANRLTIQIQ